MGTMKKKRTQWTLNVEMINMAISGIQSLRRQIRKEEGKFGSPRFFEDTAKALKEFRKIQKYLSDVPTPNR